jgi:hypothetical protein
MDERLQHALDFSNYKTTLNNQLHKLRLRAESTLIYASNGGKFTIDQQLICFFDYLVRNEIDTATVLDDNKSPIQIDDTKAFLDIITTRYFNVTNDYLAESHKIKKMRNVKSILDIKVNE